MAIGEVRVVLSSADDNECISKSARARLISLVLGCEVGILGSVVAASSSLCHRPMRLLSSSRARDLPLGCGVRGARPPAEADGELLSTKERQ